MLYNLSNMKTALLLAIAPVFTTAFVLLPGTTRAWTFQPPKRSSSSLSSLDRNREFPEVDLQAAIYDVQGVKEQHLTEVRKTGLELTMAVRNMEVEHKKELEKIDATIKAATLKKAYTELAFLCFKRYVKNGSLEFKFVFTANDEDEEERAEEDTDQSEFLTDAEHFAGMTDESVFNKEVLETCLAKYGFVYVSHRPHSSYYRRSDEFLLNLELASHNREEPETDA